MIDETRDYFRDNYPHVNFQAMYDIYIVDFLSRPHVKDLSFEKQMDLMYDDILSQDLCEVIE